MLWNPRPIYQLLTRGRLRLILEGIEAQVRSTMSEPEDVAKGLTIEHIMPQSWEDHWPLPEGVDEEEARRERNRLVQTIGNLTLVTGRLNSSLSNAPWESKRDALLEHSNLTLNSELMNKSQWDEETIKSRSRRFAKIIAGNLAGPRFSRLECLAGGWGRFDGLRSLDRPRMGRGFGLALG